MEQKKADGARRAVKENIDLAVAVTGALGFASVLAAAGDAGAVIAGHPGTAALLTGSAFAAGYAAARAVVLKGRIEKRRRLEDRLERSFLCMSARRRKIVAEALDEGSVTLSALDGDALALCELGILGAPPVGGSFTGTSFSVQPAVVKEIVRHRDEWLGM